MAEQNSSPTTDTTESLLKKLSFHISENKQDIADQFYSQMRDFLSVGHINPRLNLPSTGSSNPVSSTSSNLLNYGSFRNNCLDETDFIFEQKKVCNYLKTVDVEAAKQFNELTNKIQNDGSMVLTDRRASLRFLMGMAKKSNNKLESILEKQNIGLAVKVTESSQSNNKVKQINTKQQSTSNGNSVEKLFPITKHNSVISTGGANRSRRSPSSPLTNGVSYHLSKRPDSATDRKPPDSGSHSWAWSRNVSNTMDTTDSKCVDLSNGLSEWDLIQGIIFTWQGIEGDVFKLNLTSHKYYIDEKWTVDKTVKNKAESLTWLGQLHNLVHKYSNTSDSWNSGMVRKCLTSYIRDQLSDYYGLVANIQTQFQEELVNEAGRMNRSLVTMERLKLLSLNCTRTLQDMVSILEQCNNDKGGYLASNVYCFLQHGDPELQELVKGILSEICKPLYSMLTNWLLDGELCDPYKEFFIGSNNNITGDKLWYDKYTVRESMLPVFISVSLANNILSVGKSINFLREICGDENPFSDRDKMKEMFTNTNVDVMYLLEREEELQQLIDVVYKHTSKRVLNVLVDKYSLLDHFQAHKRYLLLGQGDFIHHLMELMFVYLNKPADQMYPHHLNSLLVTAIRSTSAQHDDEDGILKRLDAATMSHSHGDTGWDVFYLRYHVDGPIGTVFGLSSNIYQLLFYALWKAKRMEMVLSHLWKKQITSAKSFRSVKELSPVMQQCNLLTSEMIHFIHQTQYYFLFEVLECCWNQLIDEIHAAECLDEVITAHQHFLQTVLAGVFKDEYHENLSNQLRMVYDLILELQNQVELLIYKTEIEINERTNTRDDDEYVRRRREFVSQFVPSTHTSVKILAKTYRDTVKKFVLTLNSQDDLSLQLLSVRLDFNEHYKSLDSRLVAPLTFHHRMSSVGCGSSNSSYVSPLATLQRRLSTKLRVSEETK